PQAYFCSEPITAVNWNMSMPRMAGVGAVLLRPSALRGFCTKVVAEATKAPTPAAIVSKPKGSLGSRLRSFATGFAVAGTMSGYALYFKVQWANEELSAMVREAAARQAQIERRLSALEGR
ncbi:unnamed protein product, partial [Polarella glacialis]